MSAQAPPKNTETAIEVWTPQQVQAAMGQYSEREYNRLFPLDAVSQVNPMLAPKFEIIRLTEDEIYHSDDMKSGHFAPTKVGLRRLADLAGLSTVASRRLDDGSDPAYVLWQVTVALHVPGRSPRVGIGSKEIRLSGAAVSGWSPQRLAKAREHMIRMAESKAANAAIRDLTGMRSSYPKNELLKPWVVLRWEANMAHPQVAERYLDNLLPATTAVYGPAPMLAAGESPVEVAPHLPDDDDPVDAHFTDVRTNGTAHVDTSTGEIVSETPAAGEPDWFGATEGAPKPDASPSLVERLRAATKANADKGPALNDQKVALRDLLAGVPVEQLLAVMRMGLNFKGAEPRELTAGQAAAILAVGEELGADELRRQWAEAAG